MALSGHAVLQCECLLLTQSGHLRRIGSARVEKGYPFV